MTVLFWSLCALIAWSYLLYPVVLSLLAAVAGRRFEQDESFEPMVSIVIPAYNEEAVIVAKLDNALALDYPPGKLEILVASESNDRTDGLVSERARANPGRVVLLGSTVRRGKVANLHRAVPATRGEILVFTDANAMFRRDALRKMVRWFADPGVGSVSGRLALRAPSGSASGRSEGFYWDVEMRVKKASSALGSLPGANGSLFAIRRSLYRPISDRRGDDFELPIRTIIDGYASILEPDAVSEEYASPRYRDEFRRKVRIINWMIVSAFILLGEAVRTRRWLLAWQIVSHKLNRWAGAVWLGLLLPVSLLLAPRGGIYLLAGMGQVIFYALAAAGLVLERLGAHVPKVLAIPLYFVVVNAASLMGILTCALGHEVTWHKRPEGAS